MNLKLKQSMSVNSQLNLRGFGSCYIGGDLVHVDGQGTEEIANDVGAISWPQNGHFSVGQLYVQFFLPQAAQEDGASVVFLHGGGLCGAQWEATPDGRAGWLQYALQDGFDCLVCDAAERGRAGVPHRAIVKDPAVFRSNELAWEGFRIGPQDGYCPAPDGRISFAGQKFPHHEFDTFSKLFTARWPGFQSHVQAAYDQLFQDAGDNLIIVAHSEGARYALSCAARFPKNVAKLVLVEPAGAPAHLEGSALAALADVPTLVLWGDYIEDNARWQTLKENYEQFAASVDCGDHTVIRLAEKGLAGHSHFPMVDHGNAEIWQLIAEWIRR